MLQHYQFHVYQVTYYFNRTFDIFRTYLGIKAESVVYPSRYDDEIFFNYFNPYPPVIFVTHIQIAAAFNNKS